MGDDPLLKLLPGELAARATEYAETVIEGLELVMLTGDPSGDPRAMEDIKTADMETITHALARAFALGYAAALEEPRRRGRALGGVGEAATRRARHGERRPRRRPVED